MGVFTTNLANELGHHLGQWKKNTAKLGLQHGWFTKKKRGFQLRLETYEFRDRIEPSKKELLIANTFFFGGTQHVIVFHHILQKKKRSQANKLVDGDLAVDQNWLVVCTPLKNISQWG